jgi:WD40 repeat protein
MSYCLNPGCPEPENPDDVHSCQSCGLPLLLKERYRAIEPIGQGGFGKTFLAVDEDMPSKRQCVIKQFFNQSGLKAQKAKELFVQEAVQLEKLGKQHPQIPELFAHVELGIGLFLVQEFIDGQDLLQELKQEGAFDEAKIRQLLNDLLPVLRFIHSQQVIHRDIKPDNIIRRQVDGKLFLVDFGVSKFATETALARTGTVIGTPGYAAPEQSEGKAYFSSDLFGLGATCFHLLTDTHPSKVFSQYGDWEKYLRINLNKSGIGDTLKRVLTKLLQPDISQRYQSAEEVIQDLNLEPTKATAESPLIFPTSEVKPPTQAWRCVHTLTGHSNVIQSVAISADSAILASGSSDKTIKVWHLGTGELRHTLTGHSSCIFSLAISPDGQTLASCGDKTTKSGISRPGQLLHNLNHLKSVGSVAISSDGQIFAIGGNKTIKSWNPHTGEWPRTLSEDLGYVCSIAISPDGHTLASGSTENTIKIWNLHTGQLLHTLTGHSDTVHSLAISPDGQTLVSGSFDKTVKMWDLSTAQLIRTLFEQSSKVNSIAISPDDHTLAISGYGVINILDLLTGEQVFTLCDLSGWVNSIAISLDGQTLAAGGSDRIIKIWKRH